MTGMRAEAFVNEMPRCRAAVPAQSMTVFVRATRGKIEEEFILMMMRKMTKMKRMKMTVIWTRRNVSVSIDVIKDVTITITIMKMKMKMMKSRLHVRQMHWAEFVLRPVRICLDDSTTCP